MKMMLILVHICMDNPLTTLYTVCVPGGPGDHTGATMKVTIQIPAHLAKHMDSYRLFEALEEWIGDAAAESERALVPVPKRFVRDIEIEDLPLPDFEAHNLTPPGSSGSIPTTADLHRSRS